MMQGAFCLYKQNALQEYESSFFLLALKVSCFDTKFIVKVLELLLAVHDSSHISE